MSLMIKGIGLLVVAGAILVIFTVITKQGLPLIANLGDALGGAGKGFSDFFSDMTSGFESEEDRKRDEALDIFDEQLKQKEQNARDAGFDSVEEYERVTFEEDIEDKFIDPKTGKQESPGYGISPLDPNYTQNDPNPPNETSNWWNDLFNVFSIPNAFAEESTDVIQDINNEPIITKPQGTTNIKGTVRNELDTEQQFSVYSSDSSRPVRGVIRKTPRDRTKLLTSSKKKPLETASQRANRVFIETGKFADEDRGATRYSKKNKNFDFGTNTGKGLRLPSNTSSSLRLKDRKKLAEQRALAVWNSGSISNF